MKYTITLNIPVTKTFEGIARKNCS